MLKKWLSGSVLAALVALGASAQDANTVIASVSRAIGVDNLRTMQYSATGLDFALGHAANPNLPWPKFINLDDAARRVDRGTV